MAERVVGEWGDESEQCAAGNTSNFRFPKVIYSLQQITNVLYNTFCPLVSYERLKRVVCEYFIEIVNS